MEAVHAWGIDLIRQIQTVRSPVTDLLFRGVTFLGNEEFFLLLFPFLYWCLSNRLGFRLGVLFFVTGYINFVLKSAFAQPRPFELAPGINIIEESGFGLPSGHAQSAVVLWGFLAHLGKKRWLWIPAVALMLLIGFSRLYLGVHFPTDVLGGWMIGALILAAAVLILRVLSATPVRVHYLIWLVLASLVAAVSLLALATKDTVSVIAAFWGFVVGYVLLQRFFAPVEGGSWWRRLLRLPAGLVVMLALYLGLKALFPDEGEPLYLLFRFARYALMSFWAAFGAPLVFRLLRLEKAKTED